MATRARGYSTFSSMPAWMDSSVMILSARRRRAACARSPVAENSLKSFFTARWSSRSSAIPS